MKIRACAIQSFMLFAGFMNQALAIEITGAGASFPAPLYNKWAWTYEKIFHDKINYQSIGSGGGIKQIEAKTVDFGASDMPLTADELKKYGLIQFPSIIGGVVPVVNLDGVTPGKMKLTGEALAEIFLGQIKQWNDEKLQKLNPSLTLPNTPITVVHRSDGSGTTFLFTTYLAVVNGNWKQKVGVHTTVAWPAGIGGKGNEGVSSYVQRIKGSIGYVEYAYAFQNKLTYTQLQNKDGKFVQPSAATFKNAAASADWKAAPEFCVILVNQSGEETWPISGASFILVYQKADKAEQTKGVLKFFDWSYKNGSKLAEELYYVPLPASVTKLIEAQWSQMKDSQDKVFWP